MKSIASASVIIVSLYLLVSYETSLLETLIILITWLTGIYYLDKSKDI